jgi:hypothetical protein
MFALTSARALLTTGRAARPTLHRAGLTVALCAALSACAAPPQLPAAANPDSRTAAVPYRPVLSGYRAGRPVEPAEWRGRNDAVTPRERPQ